MAHPPRTSHDHDAPSHHIRENRRIQQSRAQSRRSRGERSGSPGGDTGYVSESGVDRQSSRRRHAESRFERAASGRPKTGLDAARHPSHSLLPSRPLAEVKGMHPDEGRSDMLSERGTMSATSAAARLEDFSPIMPPKFRREPSRSDSSLHHMAQSQKVLSHVKTSWVRIWPTGETGLLQVDKSSLISSFGIQARDFHIFETQLSRNQACCVLVRAKCIIVNLAFLRCIITAQFLLMVPPDDDLSAQLLGTLKQRISEPFSHIERDKAWKPRKVGGHSKRWPGRLSSMSRVSHDSNAPEQHRGLLPGHGHWPDVPIHPDGTLQHTTPFELKALEICLDQLAQDVTQRARELELVLRPAVERLAKLVRPDILDHVRRQKSRLSRLKALTQNAKTQVLQGNQQTSRGSNICFAQMGTSWWGTCHGGVPVPVMVCIALEERLRDDKDMLSMNLTALHHEEVQLLQRVSKLPILEGATDEGDDDDLLPEHAEEASQVEMLLEWFFMNFSSVFDQLQDLDDQVAGTESVVNIRLDALQNKLLSIDVLAQGFALINYFAMGIFGFFTMNLRPGKPIIDHWGPLGNEATFLSLLLPALGGAYIIFGIVLFYLVRKNVLTLS